MIHINILCVGKLKENYLKDALNEYSKRLTKYCQLNIMELPEEKIANNPSIKDIENVKIKEGKNILSQIKSDTYLICLDLNGKQFTSEEFADKIKNIPINYNSSITFVIGGSFGLSNEIKLKSNELISFSKMTFPHQLFRIFLLEQIYRSFKINNNENYHK